MGFANRYIDDVWSERRLVPTYPPAGRVQIGDVYEKRDGVWGIRSRLSSEGFVPKVRRAKVGPWELSSKGNVELSVKLRGKVPEGVFTNVLGKAEAGVAVSFTDSFGYVISLADVRKAEMTNVNELARFVREHDLWTWHNQWMVVTTTYDAASATVLTSNTAGADAVLRAKAGVKVGASLSVADLSAGFELATHSKLEDRFVCEAKLTPLFAGVRVKFRDIVFGVTGGALPDDADILNLRLPVPTLSDEQRAPSHVVFEEFDPTA